MEDKVLLGHGSGGTMMRRIIDEVFFEAYAGDELRRGDDAAVLPELPEGARLAFSTDSFVVTPHFFPGGDIGHLAICGTVNDIATSGAKPLYLSCGFILEEGYPIDGTRQSSTWTVSCAPVFISEPKETPVETGKVTVTDQNEYEVITPSEYQETDTMPVYQAIEADLETAIKPEWLDTSGIASGEGTQDIHFSHHAVLSYGPEAAFYDEFADDQYSESYSGAIMRIVWIKDWKQHEGKFNLEKTSLSGITLEDAKKQAEALITKIGLDCNQYVCRYELDMSLDRIRNMGAIYEQSIVDGSLLTDDDWVPYNYDAIPASEEGFYLEYRPAMIDAADATHRYELVFFVNSRGIVCAHLRNQFNMGDIVEKPDKLITSDEAVARLYEEVNRSQYGADEHVVSIRKIVLSYVPVRASNKDAGMVFVPTWEIIYDDEKSASQGYDCNALFNAIDGTLIEASFR